jgi:glycosyltransferase involved in cell wall biosynthesis
MSVTTLITTYNHAEFIAAAIDSALMQRTTFEHRILISEDCSTDGTRDIVQEYAARFPDTIKLLLSAENLRSNEVVARGIRAAESDFIALLDGDDYWTAPDKLERQVAFLHANPACSMCFHNARVDTGNPADARNWTPDSQPEITTLADILCGNYIATCSTMFRRDLVDVPDWYASFFPITDWPLHVLHAERGSIGYINAVMGAYRHHPGGLVSPNDDDKKHRDIAAFYLRLNECLERRLEPMLLAGMFRYFIEWAEEYQHRGDYERAKWCVEQAALGQPFTRWKDLCRHVRNRLRLCFAGRTTSRATA